LQHGRSALLRLGSGRLRSHSLALELRTSGPAIKVILEC
jgi:hypothetical protein